MQTCVIAAALTVLISSSAPAAGEYRFDFGPQDSPVAEGYTCVDASNAYTAQHGYGWSAGAPQDYTAPRPAPRRTYWWHADPVHFFHEITNDFRHDGIESREPFSFRVDLPKGKYRVAVTIGHLTEPRYSIDVYANGRLIARGEILVLNENFCVRVAELISGDHA